MSTYVPPTSEQLPPPGANYQRSASYQDRYIPDEYRADRPPIQQQPSAPMVIPSQGRPRGPSLGGQPITGQPPIPNPGYYGTSPNRAPASTSVPVPNQGYYGSSPGYFGTSPGTQGYMGTSQAPPYPQDQPSPAFPGLLHPQPQHQLAPPPMVNPSGQMRPLPDQRRGSATSHRSHHSHHSKRSGRSHHSDRRDSHHTRQDRSRRYSEDSYYSDDVAVRRSHDSRRERERRHSVQDDRDLKPLKRTKTHRPSWGDTIYSAFNVIKDALGPRDKY